MGFKVRRIEVEPSLDPSSAERWRKRQAVGAQAFMEQPSAIQAVGALTNTWATSGCSNTDYLGMFRSVKLDLNRLRRSLKRLSPGGSLSVSKMTCANAEAVTSVLEKTRDAISGPRPTLRCPA